MGSWYKKMHAIMIDESTNEENVTHNKASLTLHTR